MPHLKTCGKCQASINDDALFCPKCGTKAQRACRQCGGVAADGDLFCHRCGESLERSQFVPAEALIDASKAVAHRINNALSIILTNSQIAARRFADLQQEMHAELQGYLQDITVAAEGGGSVIRQLQRFLDYIQYGYSQTENSISVDQITGSLQIPDVPEQQSYYADVRSESPTRVGRISILIVDDEKKIRHALSYALTLGGHHVITASDGQEALDLFHSNSYDIVFVDLKMPGMNGWELTHAIKQMSSHTMVVLMTGWSVRLDDERLRSNHVDAVLAKPFELSQINDLVAKVGNSQ